ncbi:MAG: isochorismatase family protein [Chitinophagaceae bacterium]
MKNTFLLLGSFCLMLFTLYSFKMRNNSKVKGIEILLKKRVPSATDKATYKVINEKQEWNPSETAIIICDMWNQHWCKGATLRVGELAPQINKVITAGREKGMLIVHAPSDCMDYYKDYPGRKLMLQYKNTNVENRINNDKLASEKDAVWPIYQEDGGCNETPLCKQGRAWEKEIGDIKINDKDVISDSGIEMAGLFKANGIKNVILMGVHTNMCVIGRSFGLRNMVRLGMNVVLMRDMTDAMYDARQWPNVNHFAGVNLMIEYIEKYVTPTIASTDIIGQKQFRFNNDKRPLASYTHPLELNDNFSLVNNFTP